MTTTFTETEHAISEPDSAPVPSRAGPLRLSSDEVHVWRVGLDAPPARLYATLAADERDRSSRFRFPRDRRRFIAAHGALREVLGRYLQTPPRGIRYGYNAFGKPDLGPEFGGGLRFNLSHSAGLALIAVAADSDVGVDLESIRPQSGCAEIARCFFSAGEIDQLRALSSDRHAEAFIGCWTKKEAYLKACGAGLTRQLSTFSVPLATDPVSDPVELQVASGDDAPARRWSFYTLRPTPGYVGALVIEGSRRRLRQWRWTMPQD